MPPPPDAPAPSTPPADVSLAVIKERLKDTFLLAGLATVATYPFLKYEVLTAFTAKLVKTCPHIDLEGYLFFEVAGHMAMASIAAAIGVFLSPRFGLPTFGNARITLRALWLYTLAGAVLGGATYLVWDVHMMPIIPAYYPADVPTALGAVAYFALFTEVVERFGFLTLMCGLLRRTRNGRMLAVAFHALMGAAYSVPYRLDFAAPEIPRIEWLLIGGAISVVTACVIGWVRVRRGLLDAMILAAIIDLRVVVIAVIS